MFSRLSVTCLLLASSSAVHAQEQAPPEPSPSEAATQHAPPQSPAASQPVTPAPKWDVERPRGVTTRTVRIDTDEGTWMNVDVSPDGGRVAFDMLGDIGHPDRLSRGCRHVRAPHCELARYSVPSPMPALAGGSVKPAPEIEPVPSR